MLQNNDKEYYRVRDFTAILLLKLQMRNHVIFEVYKLDKYAQMESQAPKKRFKFAVKLSFDLMDNLMLVP